MTLVTTPEKRVPVELLFSWVQQRMAQSDEVGGTAIPNAEPKFLILLVQDAVASAPHFPSTIGNWPVVLTGALTRADTDAWLQEGKVPTQWQVPATGPAISPEELKTVFEGAALG